MEVLHSASIQVQEPTSNLPTRSRAQKDIFELDILKHIRAQAKPHPRASHILGLLNQSSHHSPDGNYVWYVSSHGSGSV